MPNGIRNWQYENVANFLECHDFYLSKRDTGSHEYWVSHDKIKLVNVNRPHGTDSGYPPKTLQSMIDQSGMEREHWLKWVALGKGLQKKKLCCKKIDQVTQE